MTQQGLISSGQLARLTGLSERNLRELATEGRIPKAVDGHYQLVPTIQGLLRYYRERDENRELHDVYDSIASCAGATGIPITTMKHAKRQGCPAFRGSRVHLAPLLRWVNNPSKGAAINYDQERAQHVLLQNAKLKVQLKRQKGELIPAEEVRHLGFELGSAIRKVVTRVHRLAPSLAGQSAEVIEQRLKEEEDGILAQVNIIHEQVRAWEEKAAS
jgi:hypothetical protein